MISHRFALIFLVVPLFTCPADGQWLQSIEVPWRPRIDEVVVFDLQAQLSLQPEQEAALAEILSDHWRHVEQLTQESAGFAARWEEEYVRGGRSPASLSEPEWEKWRYEIKRDASLWADRFDRLDVQLLAQVEELLDEAQCAALARWRDCRAEEAFARINLLVPECKVDIREVLVSCNIDIDAASIDDAKELVQTYSRIRPELVQKIVAFAIRGARDEWKQDELAHKANQLARQTAIAAAGSETPPETSFEERQLRRRQFILMCEAAQPQFELRDWNRRMCELMQRSLNLEERRAFERAYRIRAYPSAYKVPGALRDLQDYVASMREEIDEERLSAVDEIASKFDVEWQRSGDRWAELMDTILEATRQGGTAQGVKASAALDDLSRDRQAMVSSAVAAILATLGPQAPRKDLAGDGRE